MNQRTAVVLALATLIPMVIFVSLGRGGGAALPEAALSSPAASCPEAPKAQECTDCRKVLVNPEQTYEKRNRALYAYSKAEYNDLVTKQQTWLEETQLKILHQYKINFANKYDGFRYMPKPGPCPQKTWIGPANVDGSKILCGGDYIKNLGDDCHILSLGSYGQYDFEVRVLEMNPKCTVHTFDCFKLGTPPKPQIKGYNYCIGTVTQTNGGRKYVTLHDAMDMAGIKKLSLLKMDIEGSEYGVLLQMKSSDSWLPDLVQCEVHYFGHTQATDVTRLFEWMHIIGYRLQFRDDNPVCPTCSEVGWVRLSNCKSER